MIINRLGFNIKELDLLFGLYVGTYLMEFIGIERKGVDKKDYPTLFKEKLIEVKGKKIIPTEKMKEIIASKDTIKWAYTQLSSLDPGDLPYGGFFESFKSDYEEIVDEV